MKVQSYLCFEGRTEEALKFYEKAIGAKVDMLMRYKEAPEGSCTPGTEDKVMHAAFHVGDTQLMASDGRMQPPAKFSGISLTINAKDEAEAKKLFDSLADGGQVQMPLAPTFFSPSFGMVGDRFGVTWMVMADRKS
jgi:PhnB protein